MFLNFNYNAIIYHIYIWYFCYISHFIHLEFIYNYILFYCNNWITSNQLYKRVQNKKLSIQKQSDKGLIKEQYLAITNVYNVKTKLHLSSLLFDQSDYNLNFYSQIRMYEISVKVNNADYFLIVLKDLLDQYNISKTVNVSIGSNISITTIDINAGTWLGYKHSLLDVYLEATKNLLELFSKDETKDSYLTRKLNPILITYFEVVDLLLELQNVNTAGKSIINK